MISERQENFSFASNPWIKFPSSLKLFMGIHVNKKTFAPKQSHTLSWLFKHLRIQTRISEQVDNNQRDK